MTQAYRRITAALTALALTLTLFLPTAAEAAAAAETTAAAAETTAAAESTAAAEPAEPLYPNALGAFGSITGYTETPLGAAATLIRYENRAAGAAAQTAFAVTASPASGARIAAVNLGANLHTREKISSLAAATSAGETLTAAVNADFFSLYTGVPMGVLVSDGRLLSTSDGRDAVGFDKDGVAVFGKVGDAVTLEKGDTSLAVSHVNKYPGVYGVYLLTRDYGETTTQKGFAATEYVLRMDGDLTLGGAVDATVVAVRAAEENGEIPDGCAVLVVPDSFATAADYAVLTPDTAVTVRITCESGFETAVSALGGGDVILRDGAAVEGVVNEEHEKTRQPRTALGVKADGSYLLLVLDGRRTGYSSGLTLTALCDMLLALGCTDAVNFDGGGSTALVTFAGGTATVQNRPSDGSERKVANAAALYEKDEIAAAAPRLTLAQDAPLLLGGATYTVAWAVENGAGEPLPHTLSAENTTLTFPEALGSAEVRDGEILLTPAAANGGGILTAETRVGDEILTASCYLRVTDTVDELSVGETLLLAPADGTVTLTLTARTGGEKVYFGDLAEVRCENDAIACARDGDRFAFAVGEVKLPDADAETADPAETTEPTETEPTESASPAEPVRGRIAFALMDRTLVVPALFGEPQTPLKLDGLLTGATVTGGDYSLTYAENGGIAAGGAFVLTPNAAPAETTAETAETTAETVETTAETAETTAETTETTAETAETTDPAEPDPAAEEPAPAPVAVTLAADGLASAGLSGRRLWLWADGISADETPYAVFTLTRADGTEETLTFPYDAYYDFAGYNGRALLTLVPAAADGVLTLRTLIGFTVTDASRTVSVGPLLLAERYDTNRYADLADHWSSYYVNALSFAGVVSGSEDMAGRTVYLPDGSLSREQFAKILCGITQTDIAAFAETELPFDDASSIAAWALPYVRAVYGAGLMRGKDTPDGRLLFAPADAITREEAFYVLGGLLGDAQTADTAFADEAEVAPWALSMLQRSVAAGLVSGYEDGTVRPKGKITRAETATMVVRLLAGLYGTRATD